MTELFFLICWTLFFSTGGLIVWYGVKTHAKVYFIIVLHFFFLTGIFYFYPLLSTVSLDI